ncbi:CPBP family intramembrane glutamic endopeptidase [Capsulimonas corticalis]|uniref:CPBP family intramembrane glutamic endopeptidase n=1 Tax=Capsulimonas corticalis TaxID=2219043 RepID=UPI002631EDE1|nr:CPBP family intramembrane glutamic endopeptidase [Capsulimonas corticalis]
MCYRECVKNLRWIRIERRLLLVLLLTLLPWPAVWFGLYRFDNLALTFALYHGLCLAPAIYWGRKLWRHSLRWPTAREWAVLAVAVVVAIPASVAAYHWIGARLFDAHEVLSVVTHRGFRTQLLIPLALYFIPVNATLEELFWRGVVLNELRGMGEAVWTFGAVWTALAFGGWHYLVIRLLLRPGWAELTVLGIVISGIFFAWLYRRTRSIVVPILWHGLVFDMAIIFVFAAVLRG